MKKKVSEVLGEENLKEKPIKNKKEKRNLQKCRMLYSYMILICFGVVIIAMIFYLLTVNEDFKMLLGL